MKRIHKGLTLVELLVVLSVLGVLGSLLATVVSGTLRNAETAREGAFGRNLVNAYLLTALDNSGELMPGMDRSVGHLELPDGRQVHAPVSNRYPFRLLAHADARVEDLLVMDPEAAGVSMDNTYNISLVPTFGMNDLLVGGHRESDGTLRFKDEVVSRQSEIERVLAFASAGRGVAGGGVGQGYFTIRPPYTTGPMWLPQAWTENAPPESYGQLHARHNGRVLAVYLDGSVELQTVEELRDMRLWSRRALANNDPRHTWRAEGGSRR